MKINIILLLIAIAFVGCGNHENKILNNTSEVFFERYTTSNNDDIMSFEGFNSNITAILRRSIYDYNDGHYNLTGTVSLENNKLVGDFTNSISKENYRFEFLHLSNSSDTLVFPNYKSSEFNNKTYTILDTSFYSISYQDTIYKNTIYNYGYQIHSDNMCVFIGKNVGVVGRYVFLENQMLYVNGNIFHDIYSKQYKQFNYYPRIE